MPDYFEWTRAIYDYTTTGLAPGDKVYLHIDHETLVDIGQANWGEHPDWKNQFCETIRFFALRNQDIKIDHLLYHLLADPPPTRTPICPMGLGWLAFQVLASYDMRPDESFSQSNYYNRLRMLLNLSGSGTLPGLSYEMFEKLWLTWNRWLIRQGWKPTAYPGHAGLRYIQYPISQCLLRQGEADALLQLFHTEQLAPRLNHSQLLQWLLHSVANYKLPPRLRASFQSPVFPSDGLMALCYQLYLDGEWQQPVIRPRQQRQQILEAGIYRYENYRSDEVAYWLYPRQRKSGLQFKAISIQMGAQNYLLNLQRPGWYEPLQIGLSDLSHTQQWPLNQAQPSGSVALPGNSCWAFVPDPLAPDMGSFATWHRPVPGDAFILLAQNTLEKPILQLKESGLISWDWQMPVVNMPGWIEYYGCRLLKTDATAWQSIYRQAPALWDLLHPEQSWGIALVHGVNSPKMRGWLADYPPALELIAPEGEYVFKLLQKENDDSYIERLNGFCKPGQAYTLEWTSPGEYLIQVTSPSGETQEKIYSLYAWETLPTPLPEHGYRYEMEDGSYLEGALVRHD